MSLTHDVLHRSTTRLRDVCYLQDLDTAEPHRGWGVGRRLILAEYDVARAAGCSRVYLQTQASNASGPALYDQVAPHRGYTVYAHDL